MTKEEVVEWFGLTSDKTNYYSEEKLVLQDGDGYKYSLSTVNLRCLMRRNGTPCRFFNNNPFTQENIETYILKNIGDYIKVVDFMNAKNAKDKFLLKCEKHNITYEKYWNVIKNGQFCNECGLEVYKSKRKNDIDELKLIAANKYGITIVSDEYINNLEPLDFICHNHKNKGIQNRSWASIITTSHSCVHCSSESIARLNSKSHEEFMSELTGECRVIVLGRYVKAHENILVECKQCGDKFHMRADHIRNGVGCSKCIQSKGEVGVEKVLTSNGIEFIKQYRFKGCKHKKPLPFDFYLPELNTCIEYDGEQHFAPVEAFGGEEEFAKTKIRDNVKNSYCKANSIKLIRIPYWDLDSIENVLAQKLNNTK